MDPHVGSPSGGEQGYPGTERQEHVMDLPDELQGVHLTRRQLIERLGMVGAGAYVSQSALAWMAGPGWGGRR
ncbi:MAG: hypothetical protein ABSG43_03260 [Solirubrobacteraceae bacterium]|jgi:hypothetical protein